MVPPLLMVPKLLMVRPLLMVIPDGMVTVSVDVIVVGGPAPPQVAASPQLPFLVAVNVAPSGSHTSTG